MGLFSVGLALLLPTQAVVAAAATETAAPVTCTMSVQALIDRAQAGATVQLPACVIREGIEVRRPVTLVGSTATEIRGSDVWTGWQVVGSWWRSSRTVPPLPQGDHCASPQCAWPEQVFVDGAELARVAANPARGQFALTGDRQILLGTSPVGRTVEVTVRRHWIVVTADDVTIRGVTFRHAGNAPQSEDGALLVHGANRFTISESHLLLAHAANLGIVGGAGHRVVDNELADAGQEGYGLADVRDTQLAGNHIHDNNLQGFDHGWEAGAGKAGRVDGLVITDNEVDHNRGFGIWCDIDCRRVTIANNRIHDNERAGILYEISSDAEIRDNVIWENGWGFGRWAWGGGIVISSSRQVPITRNVLAWNADGIAVISQDRGEARWRVRNVTVDRNTIALSPEPGDLSEQVLLGWVDDWDSGMFQPDAANHGLGNAFWSSAAEPTSSRYGWAAWLATIAAFQLTPGGQGSTYLDDDQLMAALSTAGVPASAKPRDVPLDLGSRRSLTVILAGAASVLVIGLGAARMLWRTRRVCRSRRPLGTADRAVATESTVIPRGCSWDPPAQLAGPSGQHEHLAERGRTAPTR